MKKPIAATAVILMLALATAGCAAQTAATSNMPSQSTQQTDFASNTPEQPTEQTAAPTPVPTPVQSFFPNPSPAVTPSPEYLKQLRGNAVIVNTEKEFADAMNSAYVIILEKDITISENFISLADLNALVIEEGVTLTITSVNFHAKCPIVNLGEIVVENDGRVIFFNEPDYSNIGKISIKGRDAKICFNAREAGADEIAYFLREDSLYNQLSILASSSGENPIEIIIDHNIVIPVGKTLWLNSYCVLHVPEGVTLTNNGTIRYNNEPIIEGEIDGIGKVVID